MCWSQFGHCMADQQWGGSTGQQNNRSAPGGTICLHKNITYYNCTLIGQCAFIISQTFLHLRFQSGPIQKIILLTQVGHSSIKVSILQGNHFLSFDRQHMATKWELGHEGGRIISKYQKNSIFNVSKLIRQNSFFWGIAVLSQLTESSNHKIFPPSCKSTKFYLYFYYAPPSRPEGPRRCR